MTKLRILVAGDCHWPFISRRAIKKFYDLAKSVEPTHIVQIGDLYDFYSFSRFPRNVNLFTPKQEIEQARSDAMHFWLNLRAIAPKAKKYQLIGNHDERLVKQAAALFPEAGSIIDPSGLFDFKGVQTQRGERDEVIIEDICFMHGFRSKLGDHAIHNGMSTVCGHSHVGGCVFFRRGDRVIYELNSGFLGDERTPVFSYTKQRQFARWTLGAGVIDEFGPRFISFQGR